MDLQGGKEREKGREKGEEREGEKGREKVREGKREGKRQGGREGKREGRGEGEKGREKGERGKRREERREEREREKGREKGRGEGEGREGDISVERSITHTARYVTCAFSSWKFSKNDPRSSSTLSMRSQYSPKIQIMEARASGSSSESRFSQRVEMMLSYWLGYFLKMS